MPSPASVAPTEDVTGSHRPPPPKHLSHPGVTHHLRSWWKSWGGGLSDIDLLVKQDANSLDDESKQHLHWHFHGQSHLAQSSVDLAAELAARESDRRRSTTTSRASLSTSSRQSRASALRNTSFAAPSVSIVQHSGQDAVTTEQPHTDSAPATPDTEKAATADKPHLGWQGSHYKNIVEGVHEHREAIAKRKRLRLNPDINKLVSQLWTLGVRRGVRMDLRSYMDFHLSCFHFVTAIEEKTSVDETDMCINTYEAWENAVMDWRQDTADILATYGTRTLHFDSFRDSVFELIDL